jgi:hypothetical protein
VAATAQEMLRRNMVGRASAAALPILVGPGSMSGEMSIQAEPGRRFRAGRGMQGITLVQRIRGSRDPAAIPIQRLE